MGGHLSQKHRRIGIGGGLGSSLPPSRSRSAGLKIIAMPRILQHLPEPTPASAHSSTAPSPATSISTSHSFLSLPPGSSNGSFPSSNGTVGNNSINIGTDDGATNFGWPEDDSRAGMSRSRITCMQNVEDRLCGLSARGGQLSGRDAFFEEIMHCVRRKPRGQVGYLYVGALPQRLAELLPLAPDVDPEVYLALYNKLVRVNRLQDCLLLLDNMDKIGILDMNQVYHAKFYEVCRFEKAVPEAFKFTRLIKERSLRKYTMLLTVCAAAGDVDGALRAFSLLEREGLKADCVIYTALISTCAKAGCVDLAFKLFFEMESAGVEPNSHTFGAMIDGCARVGLLAKAFGVYGIMLSKNVRPDVVIFNSLINACGRAGAIDRAFDVLSDMTDDPRVKPDHVTYGALIGACTRAGQVERGLEVYKMMHERGFTGSAEVYTAAVHAHSEKKNLDGALQVLNDLRAKGVKPDDVFFSALIDAAGQAKQIDAAYRILEEMRTASLKPGPVAFSAMMGVCSTMKDWQRALDIYTEIKDAHVIPTVSTLNALVSAICAGNLLQKALDVLKEIREMGVAPDQITYKILLNACERANEAEHAFDLHMSMMSEGVSPTLSMCDSISGICLKQIQGSAPAPEFSGYIGPLQADMCKGAPHEQWAAWALAIYRQTVSGGVVPSIQSLARLLGCLRTPESEFRTNVVDENGGLFAQVDAQAFTSISMLDSSRIYDPRAMSLFEEAAALGVVPYFSYTSGPIVISAEEMPRSVAEVCILTILKSLKHRLAAGAKLPSLTISLPAERKESFSRKKAHKEIVMFGRTGQAVLALLRRLRLPFERDGEKIRLSSSGIEKWLRPTSTLPSSISFRLQDAGFSYSKLARSLKEQQREIRLKGSYSSDTDIDFDSSWNATGENQSRFRPGRDFIQ